MARKVRAVEGGNRKPTFNKIIKVSIYRFPTLFCSENWLGIG